MNNKDFDLGSLLNGVQRPKKNSSLGRGISALISDAKPSVNSQSSPDMVNSKFNVVEIDLDKCIPSRYQARKDFNEEALADLAKSIMDKGVIQPILVRSLPDGMYEIIAGERRYRASRLANMKKISAIVMDLDDKAVMEVGLIENLQRKDLNPIEEALAYSSLVKDFDYNHEDVGNLVGKSRSYISNYLRILTLPAEVLDYIESGKLTAGHGKMLVNVDGPISLANEIINNNLTVAQTENLTRLSVDKHSRVKKNKDVIVDEHINNWANMLKHKYGEHLKVDLTKLSSKSGEIRIKYKDIAALRDFISSL